MKILRPASYRLVNPQPPVPPPQRVIKAAPDYQQRRAGLMRYRAGTIINRT